MESKVIGYKVFENERDFIEWQNKNNLHIFSVSPVGISVTQKSRLESDFNIDEMKEIESPIAKIDYLWSKITNPREIDHRLSMDLSCGVFVTYCYKD